METQTDITRRTWIAAIRLAVVLSVVAAMITIGVSSVGDVPAIALVAPVMVVAFVASWVQTGRVARGSERVALPVIQTVATH